MKSKDSTTTKLNIKIIKLEIDRENYFFDVTLRVFLDTEENGWSKKLRLEFKDRVVTMENILEQARPILRRDLLIFKNIKTVEDDYSDSKIYNIEVSE